MLTQPPLNPYVLEILVAEVVLPAALLILTLPLGHVAQRAEVITSNESEQQPRKPAHRGTSEEGDGVPVDGTFPSANSVRAS